MKKLSLVLVLLCMGMIAFSGTAFAEKSKPYMFRYMPMTKGFTLLYEYKSSSANRDNITIAEQHWDMFGKVADQYLVAKYTIFSNRTGSNRRTVESHLSNYVEFYYYKFTDTKIIQTYIKRIPSEKYKPLEFLNYPDIVQEWEPEGPVFVILEKPEKYWMLGQKWSEILNHTNGKRTGYEGITHIKKGKVVGREKYKYYSHRNSRFINIEANQVIVINSTWRYGTTRMGNYLDDNLTSEKWRELMKIRDEKSIPKDFTGAIYHTWRRPKSGGRCYLKIRRRMFRPGTGIIIYNSNVFWNSKSHRGYLSLPEEEAMANKLVELSFHSVIRMEALRK